MPRKAHLLLIDDDPNTLASLARAFRLAGHEATVCDNAARAVELIRGEPFDLILSDVVMPGKNGFQVCRELKGHDQFKTIPVILVTSRDTASDKFWGEQQGADGYVTKPFTSEELLRAVKRFA